MDDLAAELGMSKKTFYTQFPSKIELLRAVLRDKFRTVEADFTAVTSTKSKDFFDTLQRLLVCVQKHTEEIQQPFVRDIQREAPEVFRFVETRRRELIQRHFGKALAQGHKAGLLRRDIPTKVVIEVLLAAMQAIVNPPKMAELGLTPKTGFSAIIKVVLEGVVTEKGRVQI